MMQGLQRFLLFHVLTYLGRNVHGSVIIHGEKAPEGSMLYMASVQNINSHVCGGFLISEDFVLTAAHCKDHSPKSVVIGTHDLRNNGQTILIEKQCKHPQYDNIVNGNDLMLLKLSNKARLSNGVDIIQIPQHDMNLNVRQTCQVAGWGYKRTGADPSHDLMVADVSIIDPQVCAQIWSRWITLPANIICAGGYGTNKGFCQGDSGGPLVCNGIAVGIVSFNKQGNCQYPDVPNVYTDISKFRDWIQKAIKTKDCQE
ncbi:mast cell protease 1A-like [Sphaeramia orbicularis]|uniref:Mast cell protease 1A-like n=1 Tax=Sphaeramia orbicularis TaxID=375764 RepID=A0A672YV63_9TELE|nr:mast cell protease 1A-like [Sphaeramia orbicularis]